MKLNMMVVMTMWLPRLACNMAGMKAHRAHEGRAEDGDRKRDPPGQERVHGQADQRDAEPADIGLALAADIEQPAMEGDRDRQTGEDEAGRVIERVGDVLAAAEGTLRPGVPRRAPGFRPPAARQGRRRKATMTLISGRSP
jgi:hypothetical protein